MNKNVLWTSCQSNELGALDGSSGELRVILVSFVSSPINLDIAHSLRHNECFSQFSCRNAWLFIEILAHQLCVEWSQNNCDQRWAKLTGVSAKIVEKLHALQTKLINSNLVWHKWLNAYCNDVHSGSQTIDYLWIAEIRVFKLIRYSPNCFRVRDRWVLQNTRQLFSPFC